MCCWHPHCYARARDFCVCASSARGVAGTACQAAGAAAELCLAVIVVAATMCCGLAWRAASGRVGAGARGWGQDGRSLSKRNGLGTFQVWHRAFSPAVAEQETGRCCKLGAELLQNKLIVANRPQTCCKPGAAPKGPHRPFQARGSPVGEEEGINARSISIDR